MHGHGFLLFYPVWSLISFLNLGLYLLPIWGSFQPLLLHLFFSAPPSFSSSSGTSVAWMLDLLLFPHRSLGFFSFFQYIFFLLIKLGNFSCSQILFIVLIPFFYWACPMSLLFQLLYYSISDFFIWLFFTSSVSLLKLPICFKRVCNFLLRHFYDRCFKLLVYWLSLLIPSS